MRSKLMVLTALVLAAGLLTAFAEGQVVPKERTPLWNGKGFSGWKLFLEDPDVDVKTVWSVKDEVIRCEGEPNGYMRTETDYANYRLHVEWRWPEGQGNSGVLLHMSEPDKVWPKSIECQLYSGDAGDFWLIDGTVIKDRDGKPNERRRVPKRKESSENPLGEWNMYDIVCNGKTVRVFVNGKLQNEAAETSVSSGKICLQSEGKPIEFRNIYVDPLPEPVVLMKKTALWNGKDFSGWKLFLEDPEVDVKTVWSVKDGVIHCTGVPNGYMRTEKDYADYKLHVEWRWAGEPSNSGVLLHTTGPDKIWPRCIEAQLQAGNAGDLILIDWTDAKERPGRRRGFFGRIPKREDSSEKAPGEWNEYDIICKGDTVRVFVNGVLQNEGTEATETAGKICLQSEGKPIEFRNVYIEPLEE